MGLGATGASVTRLEEVTAGIEFVLRIVDQAYDAVTVLADLVLLAQVQLRAVIDGSPLCICDDFDERPFALGLVGGRLEHDGEFIGVKDHQASDRDDPDAIDEEFKQGRVETFAGFREHHIEHFRG